MRVEETGAELTDAGGVMERSGEKVKRGKDNQQVYWCWQPPGLVASVA